MKNTILILLVVFLGLAPWAGAQTSIPDPQTTPPPTGSSDFSRCYEKIQDDCTDYIPLTIEVGGKTYTLIGTQPMVDTSCLNEDINGSSRLQRAQDQWHNEMIRFEAMIQVHLSNITAYSVRLTETIDEIQAFEAARAAAVANSDSALIARIDDVLAVLRPLRTRYAEQLAKEQQAYQKKLSQRAETQERLRNEFYDALCPCVTITAYYRAICVNEHGGVSVFYHNTSHNGICP